MIWEAEMAIFMRQRIDPLNLEERMTMLDLQNFLMLWNTKVEQEQKERDQGGSMGEKLMKSLRAIRNILNYMFQNED